MRTVDLLLDCQIFLLIILCYLTDLRKWVELSENVLKWFCCYSLCNPCNSAIVFLKKTKKRIILYSFSTLIHNLSCCLLGRGEIMKKYAVQSAAGRIAAGTCKRVHITPILGTLYWLQVSFSIDYEVLLLDFKALSYIMACLSLYVPNCSLRYSTAGLLSARKVNKLNVTKKPSVFMSLIFFY